MAPVDAHVIEEDEQDKLSEASDFSWSTESCYGLRWLFDPNRHDDLPIEEQLKFYKQRDLRAGKIYKIATEIWKAPVKRKRVHFAPPMFVGNKAEPKVASEENVYQGKVLIPAQSSQSEAEVAAKKYRDEFDSYKSWIAQRKKFRHDLDNMGVSEEWLSRKPHKTPLEKKLLQKMIVARTPVVVAPPKVEVPSLNPIPTKHLPVVHRPAPKAIQIIEKFLHKKKMRLIDLFSSVDKTKIWKISRAAFRTAIQEAGIPISDIMLEDLILALDINLNDELDYREIARGMSLWKIEKRDYKEVDVHHSASSANLSHHLGYGPAIIVEEEYSAKSVPEKDKELADGDASKDSRTKSAASTSSTASTRFLTPPPSDRIYSEARPFSSAEARLDHRKMERHILKQHHSGASQSPSSRGRAKTKGIHLTGKNQPVKTGNPAVDKHSLPSTLANETGDLVDKFRQLKLKEYYAIVNLCKENNVQLTEKLLERVLLHPPDKPYTILKTKIRQPGQLIDPRGLTSTHKPFLETKTKKKAKENRSPDRFIQSRSESSSGKFRDTTTNILTLNGQPESSVGISKDGDDDIYREVHSALTAIDSKAALIREKRIKGIYPSLADIAPSSTKMYLSTGKAAIHRQVDCWMSFEEYDNLTSHLAHKYRKVHGPTDDNAFWPGHLLDKMRLCLPGSAKHEKKSSMFKIIEREKPVYPLLGHKPVLAYL